MALPNALMRLMALLSLVVIATITSLPAGADAIGVCAQDCYGGFSELYGCFEVGEDEGCFCRSAEIEMSIITACASICSEEWSSEVDSMPCDDTTGSRQVAAPLKPLDTTVEYSLQEATNSKQHRFSPSRESRQKRHGLVATLTAKRSAIHLVASVDLVSDHPSEAPSSPTSKPASSAADKLTSPPLKKNTPPDRPKWQPTICTVPGVTCAEAGSAGNAGIPKHEIRDEPQHRAQLLPAPPVKRDTDAEPDPRKVRKWKPTLCTSEGITCAVSGGLDSEFASTDTSSQSDDKAAADSQPAAPKQGGSGEAQ